MAKSIFTHVLAALPSLPHPPHLHARARTRQNHNISSSVLSLLECSSSFLFKFQRSFPLLEYFFLPETPPPPPPPSTLPKTEGGHTKWRRRREQRIPQLTYDTLDYVTHGTMRGNFIKTLYSMSAGREVREEIFVSADKGHAVPCILRTESGG